MRAVLFDLGNTLVSYYAAADFAPILRRCLRGCIEVLEPDLRLDEDEIFQRALTLNVERADHVVWPLADRLNTLFNRATSDSAIEQRLAAAFLEPIFATAMVDPGALATLASLRAAGFRTAIVSNAPWGSPAQPWRAELARHHLLAAVDAAVFCVDVGYRKPHRAPFERALSLVGARAAEAFFVGDDPRWDVTGAELAGIRPILLAPAKTETVRDTTLVAGSLREVLTLANARTSLSSSASPYQPC
jgi:FMN phosphatase YigB (HAD superfamily)